MADADPAKTTTGGTTTTTAGGQATQQLRTVRAQLAERTTELEGMRGELEQLRAKAETSETLSGEIKRLKAEIAGLGEAHATERVLFAAGLTDPDEVELLKFAHGRLPEKDRPKLGEWVEGLRKDPSKAPKLLQAVTARWTETTTKDKPTTTTTSRRAPRARVNRSSSTDDDTSSGQPTDAEWQAARLAAQRGDRKPLDALKSRVGLPTRPGRR
jgi:hypothetical protein